MDDAAVLPIGGAALVLTHDMMVAGTHFPRNADPADVAWKLLAVNLSDLAAKGAKPLGVLLGYMLGDDAWDAAFVQGLHAALTHYAVPLLGGDTVSAPDRSGPRALGLTALGLATHSPVPGRDGARPGDRLWITGEVGDAMLGFQIDRDAERTGGEALPREGALERFRRPQPRLSEGQALAPLVHAMMDVSDGLLLDALRMAQASGVTLALDRAAIPHSAQLRRAAEAAPALLDEALRWGDDYELLCALPDGVAPPTAATCIGMVLPQGPHPLLIDARAPDSGAPLGWQHAW